MPGVVLFSEIRLSATYSSDRTSFSVEVVVGEVTIPACVFVVRCARCGSCCPYLAHGSSGLPVLITWVRSVMILGHVNIYTILTRTHTYTHARTRAHTHTHNCSFRPQLRHAPCRLEKSDDKKSYRCQVRLYIKKIWGDGGLEGDWGGGGARNMNTLTEI